MKGSKKKVGKYIVDMGKKLGEGAFAQVYLANDTQTKQDVAVKVVIKQKINQDAYTKNAFTSQIQIMKKLKSKNIIRFLDVHETKSNYYIMLELANDGNFRDILQNKKCLSEKQALPYIVQLLNGFGQLVKNGVIHRDVKPDNIFVRQGILKIGDFGFAKNSDMDLLLSTIVGSPAYMAPQILKQQKYTYKCDIWSLGVIVYEMLFGSLPFKFNKPSLSDMYNVVASTKINFPPQKPVSEDMKSFVAGCLQVNQKLRFDWQNIFMHPLFGGIFKNNFSGKKQGSTKLAFIIGQLRMVINSNNLNMEKQFKNLKKNQLKKEQFKVFINYIASDISWEDIQVLFTHVSEDNVVKILKFQDLLKKYGCRMSGADLNQIQLVSSEPETSILAKAKIKKAVQTKNIDFYQVYKNMDMSKNNALTLQNFQKLIKQIDQKITPQQINDLFIDFDLNKDKKISFQEFYKGMCKIGEQVCKK